MGKSNGEMMEMIEVYLIEITGNGKRAGDFDVTDENCADGYCAIIETASQRGTMYVLKTLDAVNALSRLATTALKGGTGGITYYRRAIGDALRPESIYFHDRGG